MLLIAAILLVVLAVSVQGLRTSGRGARWPFLIASVLSGGAVLAVLIAMGVALIAGRDTWNSWVSGSRSSETVTLWLLLVVGPTLLATCCALLIIGAVLRARGDRSGQASPPS